MPSLDDVNARYFLWYVGAAAAARPQLKVLDFGCGSGEVVGALRAAGVDAYGAETFYGGGDYAGVFESSLFRDGHLCAIGDGGRVPFDDAAFDLVLSNQVLEHVEDLEQVTAEIHRLLRPGGIAYHHFPSREVVREGHLGIPLLALPAFAGPAQRAFRRLGFMALELRKR